MTRMPVLDERRAMQRELDRLAREDPRPRVPYAAKRRYHPGSAIALRVIVERDEGICQLCGNSVDVDARFPDRQSPSRDHIIPLSRGGSDLPENVQLAHLGCNMDKGASVPAEDSESAEDASGEQA